MTTNAMRTAAPALLAGLVGILSGCGSDSSSSGGVIPGDQCQPSMPATEVCDGKDNDCDGKVDQDAKGNPLSEACDANGKPGKRACVGATWGTCSADCSPVAEDCNGKDDDCDGKVDQDSQGNALTKVCDFSGTVGKQVCANGAWGDCKSACTPATEECNGKDDDCDGKVDQDSQGSALTRLCDLSGKTGKETCANGAWGECKADCTPTTEDCNGKDDDCDGKVDQDSQGNALTKICDFSGKTGTQTCANGAWSGCVCNVPELETCNGKDDDCDGKIDEDDTGVAMKRSCDTLCGPGTELCVNGAFVQCNAKQPEAEKCDGVDNNCDGTIDEGFECAKGNQDSCGTDVGVCELGTRLCDATCHWGQCLGGKIPAAEACDGVLDEDCDGTVDNGCGCTNGATKDCCGGAKITCANGAWPACPATPKEVCDSVDNDCNGLVDDGLPTDPYLLEEDVTSVDDCAHAKPIATTVIENEPALTGNYYLYKKDLKGDKDFFSFNTQEVSDLLCVWNPKYNECYTLTVTLTEPVGQDYQMCLYDVDLPGSGYTCAAPAMPKVCTTPGTNTIKYNISGGCGYDESFSYYLEVFPATGVKDSCKPYKVSIQLTGSGPQSAACTFPF